MKPYILISNDDGYQAPGIRYLIEILKPLARLIVVAPDGPRSGYACKITTKEPFTLQPISDWQETADVVGCITVYCGVRPVRLIDNIRYKG